MILSALVFPIFKGLVLSRPRAGHLIVPHAAGRQGGDSCHLWRRANGAGSAFSVRPERPPIHRHHRHFAARVRTVRSRTLAAVLPDSAQPAVAVPECVRCLTRRAFYTAATESRGRPRSGAQLNAEIPVSDTVFDATSSTFGVLLAGSTRARPFRRGNGAMFRWPSHK